MEQEAAESCRSPCDLCGREVPHQLFALPVTQDALSPSSRPSATITLNADFLGKSWLYFLTLFSSFLVGVYVKLAQASFSAQSSQPSERRLPSTEGGISPHHPLREHLLHELASFTLNSLAIPDFIYSDETIQATTAKLVKLEHNSIVELKFVTEGCV